MRRVGVVSVGRSDYSILRPVLNSISKNPQLSLELIVSGMHLVPEFGYTVRDIEKDGWNIVDRLEHVVAADTPSGISKSIGLGVIGFSDIFAKNKPDILLLMGDRFEMFCAAVAAQPFSLPVAHIHGGETTEGAIDEAFRHSITKMSHIHFATTINHKNRIIQLGEDPKNVVISGAPALDNVKQIKIQKWEKLKLDLNLCFPQDVLPFLVTMHPETVLPQQNLQNLEKLFSALEIENSTAVFTAANADTMGRAINEAIEKRCAKNKNFVFRPNLGLDLYYQFMANCRAMIGNSSSGIIEAASFKTPVINVGSRQKGRTKGINVIDANFEVQSIVKSIHMLKSRSFAGGLRACANPYFFGGASKIIADKLLNVELESQLMLKKFFDYELKGLTG